MLAPPPDAKERVRFALVGVAHPHAAGFLEQIMMLPDVDVAAFYDPDPGVARPLLPPAYQDRPFHDDLTVLLERERPEAVIICLPNDVTPAAIMAAADAGVHVYAEKPCAVSADAFRPAARAIDAAGVQFATGYLRRFAPVGRAIKEIVDQGLLGRLVSVEARWVTTRVDDIPWDWLFRRERSGGGILHWLGCHWLDLMRWTTAAEVSSVAAMMTTHNDAPIDVEDGACVALQFDNGMIGSLHCAYVTEKGQDQLFFGLRGALGWLNWEGNGTELVARSVHPAWQTAPTRVMRFEPDPAGGYWGAAGAEAIRQFIASFREQTPPAFTTTDALRVLETLDAVQMSAQSRRFVSLNLPALSDSS